MAATTTSKTIPTDPMLLRTYTPKQWDQLLDRVMKHVTGKRQLVRVEE